MSSAPMIEETRSKKKQEKNAIDISISLFFASNIYICKNVFFDVMSIRGKNQS